LNQSTIYNLIYEQSIFPWAIEIQSKFIKKYSVYKFLLYALTEIQQSYKLMVDSDKREDYVKEWVFAQQGMSTCV
jgi:hypothetical protein